jgi:20S proteasome alpha/beta subunit
VSKRGILIIDDGEEVDLSMTMIIGMETATGIIVATDGFAKFNQRGSEHLGFTVSNTAEKVSIVAPRIMVGITGSKVNWMKRFESEVTAFASQSPKITAQHVAGQLPNFIQYLYGSNSNDPDFFIAIFVAGVTETGAKEMYLVDGGEIMAWPDGLTHPWLTVGHENQVPDAYIQSQYKGRLFSRVKTINLLKEAVIKAGEHVPEAIGGHTFVYEITKNGITRLE